MMPGSRKLDNCKAIRRESIKKIKEKIIMLSRRKGVL
jgi:hypothetical protein